MTILKALGGSKSKALAPHDQLQPTCMAIEDLPIPLGPGNSAALAVQEIHPQAKYPLGKYQL